jgi:D-glycero-alpha-D-manno-heptose-7-phosphate kinase
MNVIEGIEVHHIADLPARTGLGTSSAFTVGLLLGLYALKNQMRDKHSLNADAIHVEQELLKEAVGSQDQTSAAYGGFNRINFHTDGGIEVRRTLADPGRLAQLEQNLALFFTGFSRIASAIATEQIKRTPQKRKELGMMHQLVDEAEAIVSSPRRPLDDFGRLLHESWQIKRSLTQKISNADIDQIYEAGLSAGALGGKLLGAGAAVSCRSTCRRRSAGWWREAETSHACRSTFQPGQPRGGLRTRASLRQVLSQEREAVYAERV